MSRIVNEDLDRACLKKPTAPKLTDALVAQRKVHAKPFSLLVSGGREQYILTLDEAWISLDFTNGSSPIHYAEKTKSERTGAPPVATSAPRLCQKTLYAAGFTWRGQTGLYFIPPNTTISSEVFMYLKYVLEPMLTKDVPRLYGKEASKMLGSNQARMLGWILMDSSTLLNFNGWPIPLMYHRWTSLETGG